MIKLLELNKIIIKGFLFINALSITLIACINTSIEPLIEEVPPIEIVIDSIYILKFPQEKINGFQWDVNSGPDLFLRISDSLNDNNFYETLVSSNCEFGDTIKLDIEEKFTTGEVTKNYIWWLYDEDPPPFGSELMNSYSFKLFHNKAFDTITVSNLGVTTRIKFFLTNIY